MSFPRLILSGSASLRKITGIAVTYDNDTVTDKPALITRARYDVSRKTRVESTGVGSPVKYPNMPYDSFRLVHNWVGYIDVLTESVAITASSIASDSLTVALIKSAVILEINHGVEHTIDTFTSGELGPNKASLAGTYTTAFEQGLDWVYKTDPDKTEYTTIFWFIRGITIADNGNNTSRVTFSLEFAEPWESLAEAIDAL